jgi:nicotinamidase-related amidase
MLVSAPGVAISSCKLRTRQDADRGFARPDAGKRPTVLAAAAEQCVRETQVDALYQIAAVTKSRTGLTTSRPSAWG